MSPPTDSAARGPDADAAAPMDDATFNRLMARLEPWPAPDGMAPVAVAVSGGADSLCLAVLVAAWARHAGVPVLALVVDHRLRPESAKEADVTVDRLRAHAIPFRLLPLDGLLPGPGLAERARIARYDALTCACREAGAVDLLLGHHLFDQAETVLMRERAGSGPDGLAGMSPLLELDGVRLLRPLLAVPPARLRATLVQRGVGWVEDPSNRDRRAGRTGLREELATDPALRRTVLRCAREAGRARLSGREADASILARTVSLRPEGFALLPPGLPPAGALAALVRTVGGREHRPAAEAINRLLRAPRAATVGGVRLLPAGRLGSGWLMLREAAAMQPAVAAGPGVCWDNRFVLRGDGACPDGLFVSALGADAAGLRQPGRLPAAVLRTLPALRNGAGDLLAVPHLGWCADDQVRDLRFLFQPPSPVSESVPFTIV